MTKINTIKNANTINKNTRINLVVEIANARKERAELFLKTQKTARLLKICQAGYYKAKNEAEKAEEEEKDQQVIEMFKAMAHRRHIFMRSAQDKYELVCGKWNAVNDKVSDLEKDLRENYMDNEAINRLITIYKDESKSMNFRIAARNKAFNNMLSYFAWIYNKTVAVKYNYQVSFNEALPVIMEKFEEALASFKGGKFTTYFSFTLSHLKLEDHYSYTEVYLDPKEKKERIVRLEEKKAELEEHMVYNAYYNARHEEMTNIMEKIMECMEARDREMVEERLDEKTYKEIGEEFNMSDEGAKKRIERKLAQAAQEAGVKETDLNEGLSYNEYYLVTGSEDQTDISAA